MPIACSPVCELLTRSHERKGFDCGEPDLNVYLERQAWQDMRRGVARVFIACSASSPRVMGYYSLSAASFSRQDLPADEARRLPYYPVPAALLGRLAMDKSCQGRGLGKFLLFDAFYRVLQASEVLAVYALIVDTKNDRVRTFYEHYGFLRFPETPSRLFIPLETLQRGVESSSA